MRVGVNLTGLVPGAAGGMETYLRGLLAEMADLDRGHEFFVVLAPFNRRMVSMPRGRWRKMIYYGAEGRPECYRSMPPGGRLSQAGLINAPRRLIRRLRCWPAPLWEGDFAKRIGELGVDVWFCPLAHVLPLDPPVPVVHLIPDLQHEAYPENFSAEELAYRILGYAYGTQAAETTLALSQASAADLQKAYGLESDKTIVAPPGVDPIFRVAEPGRRARLAQEGRGRFRLERPFLLYPANGWRHKNHEMLVRAHAVLLQRLPSPVDLVLTGEMLDLAPRLEAVLQETGVGEFVHHLGRVSKADLARLYVACEAVVFPSLYEGFGIPVLEAMAMAVPVVASSAGGLQEAGGDAVWRADPDLVEDWAARTIEVVTRPELRERLAEAGPPQAQRFSYSDSARTVMDVLEHAATRHGVQPRTPPFRPPQLGGVLRGGVGRWYLRAPGAASLSMTLTISQGPQFDLKGNLSINLDGNPVQPQWAPSISGELDVTLDLDDSCAVHRLEIVSHGARLRRMDLHDSKLGVVPLISPLVGGR